MFNHLNWKQIWKKKDLTFILKKSEAKGSVWQTSAKKNLSIRDRKESVNFGI